MHPSSLAVTSFFPPICWVHDLEDGSETHGEDCQQWFWPFRSHFTCRSRRTWFNLIYKSHTQLAILEYLIPDILSVVQFVKRMGVRTHKSRAMCLPQKIMIEEEPPEFLTGNTSAKPFSPATVLDRKDVGDVMKYWVKFDDGIVSHSCLLLYLIIVHWLQRPPFLVLAIGRLQFLCDSKQTSTCHRCALATETLQRIRLLRF